MDGMYPPPALRKPPPRPLVVKPSLAKTSPDTITTSEGTKIVLKKGSIATEQV